MKLVFGKDGIPRCSLLTCSSSRFEGTFVGIGDDQLKLESAYCSNCLSEVELTLEFVAFIEKEKWRVSGQSPRVISILG